MKEERTSARTIISDSTKLATFPSSSRPERNGVDENQTSAIEGESPSERLRRVPLTSSLVPQPSSISAPTRDDDELDWNDLVLDSRRYRFVFRIGFNQICVRGIRRSCWFRRRRCRRDGGGRRRSDGDGAWKVKSRNLDPTLHDWEDEGMELSETE